MSSQPEPLASSGVWSLSRLSVVAPPPHCLPGLDSDLPSDTEGRMAVAGQPVSAALQFALGAVLSFQNVSSAGVPCSSTVRAGSTSSVECFDRKATHTNQE